jgi:glycosyltransferase involved in cell wall biosynthesis
MRTSTISVILPCFERLPFLRSAVESVFAQTLRDWELVIADDGSGAAVQTFLQDLVADTRIRVLRLAHSGNPAAVRNAALRAATSEYIAFLDSDDVWLPSKLELQVASLRRHRECSWGYTAYGYIDATGQPSEMPELEKWMPHEGQAIAAAVELRLMSALPSVIAKRSLLEEVGGFDENKRFYEDHHLWFRLALRSNADVVPEVLLHIRKHDKHYSDTDRLGATECKAELLREMYASVFERSQRELIRRQRALCAATLARSYLATPTGRSRAIRALLQSTPYSWPYSRWWASALRTVAASVGLSRGGLRGSAGQRAES